VPIHPSLLELRAKVDTFFTRVQGTHPEDFACRRGCTNCCEVDLTVFPVEADPIKEALANSPKALRAGIAARVAAGKHCVMLVDGACAIYDQRPIICRSQGLPLQTGSSERATCPLNFVSTDLAGLDHSDVLNLNTLNTLLSMLHQVYCKESGVDSARVRLAALMSQ
jgi:uncharacterized protein